MQVRGLARVVLAPLVDTLPCLGAVQISLLEEPYIDFSISLFGSLDLMLLPIFKDAVNFAAKKVSSLSCAAQPGHWLSGATPEVCRCSERGTF